VFSAWSDGGARQHTIATPGSAASYTAAFVPGVAVAVAADAHVRGGSYAAQNYGTAALLETKLGSSSQYTRQAYLKFDIAAVQSVQTARLRLFGSLTSVEDRSTLVRVSGVPDTSWNEGTLTWANKPALSAQLAAETIVDTTPRWYEWDVTSYVRAERSAGRAVLSLALSNAASTDQILRFHSRQAATNRPELIIGAAAATPPEVVLRAADASIVGGKWQRVADATAAGGSRLSEPNAGVAKVETALAVPADHVEFSFDAEAGRPYRLWIRGRAASNYWGNDSAHVQFSGSVTAGGAAIYRIGSTSSTVYVLEDCHGCGLSGWGWQDNGYGPGVLGPLIYFASSGRQTLRLQSREDGLSIDQIVLSPAAYLSTSPGATKNDTTIVAR
jgi:hypothetical protein